MKTLKMLVLGSALIGVTQVTQGSVLLGFNSFTEDVVDGGIDSSADETKAGWSGSIDHVGQGFVAIGGSDDGFYGNDWDQPGIGHMIYSAPPVSDNGYIDGAAGVMFSGVAGTSEVIHALLFDAASVGSASTFNVSWKFWDDALMTNQLASSSSSTLSVGPGTNTNYTSNYQDYAVNLGSFFLPAGGYFEIVWNRVSGAGTFKLDNIALVPEPGSMLGLGCLVGFGTLLRSRRRTGPAVIA
jgi:hypothetical protein